MNIWVNRYFRVQSVWALDSPAIPAIRRYREEPDNKVYSFRFRREKLVQKMESMGIK